MSAKILDKINKKILVVGPIYNKIDLLNKIINIQHHYDYIILNGGICYPNDNILEVTSRIGYLDQLLKDNQKLIYNVNHDDLQLIVKLYNDISNTFISDWIKSKSNVVICEFTQTQSTIIITGGGWSPGMTKDKLKNNMETSFISTIRGIPWQKIYGGFYGYIISNNPLEQSPPQFYEFSARIGTQYGENVQIYAQEADCFGLKNTILL